MRTMRDGFELEIDESLGLSPSGIPVATDTPITESLIQGAVEAAREAGTIAVEVPGERPNIVMWVILGVGAWWVLKEMKVL